MTDSAPKLLKEIELFSELDDKHLEEVATLAQVKKIPTDTTIFHEGDAADAVNPARRRQAPEELNQCGRPVCVGELDRQAGQHQQDEDREEGK
jgi:hypothetical protein